MPLKSFELHKFNVRSSQCRREMLYTFRPVTSRTNSCLRAECKFAEQWKRWRRPIASASGVSDELAVVCEIRRGFAAQRLEDQNSQFEDDPLLHWRPVYCNRDRTGEMWSRRLVPVRSRQNWPTQQSKLLVQFIIFIYHNWLADNWLDLTWYPRTSLSIAAHECKWHELSPFSVELTVQLSGKAILYFWPPAKRHGV